MREKIDIKETELEDSMLRSVILFDHKKVGKKRSDMILKVILSIITYGGGRYGVSEIKEILSDRFKVTYDDKVLSGYLQKLEYRKLIQRLDNAKYQDVSNTEKGREFDRIIREKTESLYKGVLHRLTRNPNLELSTNDKNKVIENIQKALTQYFKMFGMAYFDLKLFPTEDKITDAVTIAQEGLPKNLQAALVGALCDVVCKPTQEEKDTLEMWARAYITMAVMNLDPSLRNFKATILNKKTFYIDTDVALYAITTHTHRSQQYRQMVETLVAIGCRIVIPTFVEQEIQKHIDAANKRYSFNGSSWNTFSDEFLVGKDGNVFVEDYIRTVREEKAKEGMSFPQYIRNFYAPEDPSLLKSRLKKVFKKASYEDISLQKLDNEIEKKLKAGILEKTENSYKGSRRSSEENEEIAENDAKMYLRINECNTQAQDRPLSLKVYLLSSSRKVITTAKILDIYKQNIVCSPFSLISSLQEIGMLDHEVGIMNLFSNPFLVVTASRIEGDIKSLLEAGVEIKYNEIERLRVDVDAHVDRILTCDTYESKVVEARRLKDRGFSFADDLIKSAEEMKKVKVELEKERDMRRSLEERLKRIDKEKGKESYEKRLRRRRRG